MPHTCTMSYSCVIYVHQAQCTFVPTQLTYPVVYVVSIIYGLTIIRKNLTPRKFPITW